MLHHEFCAVITEENRPDRVTTEYFKRKNIRIRTTNGRPIDIVTKCLVYSPFVIVLRDRKEYAELINCVHSAGKDTPFIILREDGRTSRCQEYPENVYTLAGDCREELLRLMDGIFMKNRDNEAACSAERKLMTRRTVCRYLEKLGLNAGLLGTEYLRDIVTEMCSGQRKITCELIKELYSSEAEKRHTAPALVESAVRKVIRTIDVPEGLSDKDMICFIADTVNKEIAAQECENSAGGAETEEALGENDRRGA